jgi:Protein of unknown function (DUF3667)
MTIACKNCNTTYEGKFCNNCGQTANTHDIDFKSVVHEIQHSLLHVDKGILYTTKELLQRPGQTIREYLTGKRVKHFKPFAYIFLLSSVYAVMIKATKKSSFLNDFLIGFNSGTTDSKTKTDLVLVGDAVLWMSNHYAYSTLILLPVISLASYLCFYRSKYNYFQHLILNSFVAGQRTAVYLILLPFTYLITDKAINETIDGVKIYLGFCLTLWTYYKFFNTTKPIKRVFFTLLTYMATVVLLFLAIIVITLTAKLLK